MIDRRRSEIRTDTATLGLVVFVMGLYASPFSPMDTLFTKILGDAGLEYLWAFLMMLTGVCKICTGVISHPPLWIERHWPAFLTYTNLAMVFVSWWTFLQFVAAEQYTPTVLALGAIGFGALGTLIRDAIKKKQLRCRYARLYDHG